MIDQGLSLLVNYGLSSPPFANGGYLFQLQPKNPTFPAWTYKEVVNIAETSLQTAFGFARLRLQIDVYGSQTGQGADSVVLAQSIDRIMNGFSGILPDQDATFVSSCFRIDRHDFFSDTFRTWGRMLEYEILYSESD